MLWVRSVSKKSLRPAMSSDVDLERQKLLNDKKAMPNANSIYKTRPMTEYATYAEYTITPNGSSPTPQTLSKLASITNPNGNGSLAVRTSLLSNLQTAPPRRPSTDAANNNLLIPSAVKKLSIGSMNNESVEGEMDGASVSSSPSSPGVLLVGLADIAASAKKLKRGDTSLREKVPIIKSTPPPINIQTASSEEKVSEKEDKPFLLPSWVYYFTWVISVLGMITFIFLTWIIVLNPSFESVNAWLLGAGISVVFELVVVAPLQMVLKVFTVPLFVSLFAGFF